MEYKTRYRDWLNNYIASHTDEKIRARDIYKQMEDEGLKVNRATLYRNLERLEKEQKLQSHKSADEDEKFYQVMKPKMDCQGHLHLVCARCGRIIHLNCSFMSEIQEHLLEDHGFALDCGQSMLVGLCRECREKSGKEDRNDRTDT